jgi:hypothetical protein
VEGSIALYTGFRCRCNSKRIANPIWAVPLPRLLKDLQINDVSSVDRGAGVGVKVMLMKRDETLKRKFTTAQRDNAAESGAAMPDGSFPIHNEEDLASAVRLAGNAKNPAKAKAHIKSRASALGATDALPESWSKRDNVIDMRGMLKTDAVKKDAIDYETAAANGEAAETGSDIVSEMDECICALRCAICSILEDPEVNDKSAAIEESFKQFQDYIAGLTPDNLEKAMTPVDLKKQIDDAVAAALKDTTEKVGELEKTNKALADENVVLKMSDKHKAFHSGLDNQDAKDKFAAKSPEERDAQMEKTKKSIDPEIAKRLADAEGDRAMLKALIEKDEKQTFAKRATDLGLTVDQGELLRKAHHGDVASLQSVEDIIGTMTKAMRAAQSTGLIFKEFGAQGETRGTTAMDQLNAKADELSKSEIGKDLSQQQAFAKVYADPANAEIVKRETQERRKAMGVAA